MAINSFVIEGAVGADLYEKITEAFELCVEFDKYYEIGRVNGKVYTIQKSKNEYCEGSVIYGFSVWDNVVPGNGPDIASSETKPDCVELKDGNLHISGGVYRGGVLRYYISDVKLHKLTNIYFDTSDVESDKEEATNDVDGKYFKRMCYFEGDCEIGDDTIPENYYDLPVEEQLSICKSLAEKGVEISYRVTRLCETEKFFDITAWRRS